MTAPPFSSATNRLLKLLVPMRKHRLATPSFPGIHHRPLYDRRSATVRSEAQPGAASSRRPALSRIAEVSSPSSDSRTTLTMKVYHKDGFIRKARRLAFLTRELVSGPTACQRQTP